MKTNTDQPTPFSPTWYRKRAEETRHSGRIVSEYNHFLAVADAIAATQYAAIACGSTAAPEQPAGERPEQGPIIRMGARAGFRRRKDGIYERHTPDGRVQTWDPVNGYNHGSGPFPQPEVIVQRATKCTNTHHDPAIGTMACNLQEGHKGPHKNGGYGWLQQPTPDPQDPVEWVRERLYMNEFERLVFSEKHALALAERCRKAEFWAASWKANHDNQVRLKRALADRPDLKERTASWQKLQDQLAAAQADAAEARAISRGLSDKLARLSEPNQPTGDWQA